ncbi:major facilitator superfamily domain-containing protein [Aspergillus pseudonomiae]|uniref:Major facilitator superfamily domain-containing protein n=1 Tax=Aspergillus pseudonomiae TaxID=1506151 RepID=A0A5N7DJA4_9EURO|nr:major facilitator superfamily domain-containing protein [Aspergillus pseudonomiae]KAB8255654.1 major facilitator superfamily domain-containing protein [Aspergillus pseudonomiae]KAE8406424.1 major facilitator superfamily domain-containing protein [Aspergillus pseudonomiae]
MVSNNEFGALHLESDLSQGMIAWDGQGDTHNPRNFSPAKKWTTMLLLSAMIALSFLTSTIVSPAASHITSEFHVESAILSSLITTIFVLAYMLYGRRLILNCTNAVFTLSHIGCALAPNAGTFLAFRIISGLAGSVSLSAGGGIVPDLFDVHERGVPNALVTTGSLFGPVLGPLFGGIITQRAGWRWIFWVLLIACAVVSIAMAAFTPETNAAVIIRHKASKLRKDTGREDLQSAYDSEKASTSFNNPWLLVGHAISRPWKMLFHSPLLVILCIMVGLISGLLYTLLTTTSSFFQEFYRWSLETAGLAYMGLGLGSLVGLIVFAKTSDLLTVRLTKANNGIFQPEMRIVTAFLPALFIPVSFFWYGWSTQAQTHWIVPLIGLVPFGFAQVGINATAQAYVIDASGPFAASSMACVTSVRCLFGAFLPLAGPSLYSHLGLGWGNSLLGFVSLIMPVLTIIIYRSGRKFRERYPLYTE